MSWVEEVFGDSIWNSFETRWALCAFEMLHLNSVGLEKNHL
jgi:hypothetical protein